ncbi:MAG: DUF523 and DUF1722 domain-containing protein [Candidatus Thiodiazotropha sp. (ex Lucinoma borealis)]|nr:DUF523 and DUF1722 domain-containing protein [Candidatus Thiodiazotropha sp. (ex Lucinoma borealis)]
MNQIKRDIKIKKIIDNILPKVGVSACLIGHSVRYDGGHKRDKFIVDVLNKHFDLVPICPETAIGLGTPRETIRLVGDHQRPRLVGGPDHNRDITDLMESYAHSQSYQVNQFCSYILKKDSPSCGMERVKVYSEDENQPIRRGSGLFARILMEQHPLIPIEEECRLNDAILRENFINRIYVLQRWHIILYRGITPAQLLEFHTIHKYLVMAHSQASYRRLGRLIGNLSEIDIYSLADLYICELMSALKRRVIRGRHCNVIQHIMGYLKKRISHDDKITLSASIESYRQGKIPLVVPINLLKHHIKYHPDEYLQKQVYLQPYPDSIGLRDTI